MSSLSLMHVSLLRKSLIMKTFINPQRLNHASGSGNVATPSQDGDESERSKNISRVMNHYLNSLKEKKQVIADECADFETGRNHLARMMGENPEFMEQSKIDRAIQYLFPSGLYDERARPIMKHPRHVFYSIKEAQFDDHGRPFNSMFYTGKPSFYSIMHDLGMAIETLKDSGGVSLTEVAQSQMSRELAATTPLTKSELSDTCMEKIKDIEYDKFEATVSRLCEHPKAVLFADLALQCRRKIICEEQTALIVSPPMMGEDGRLFQIAEGRKRKGWAKAEVKLDGTGLLQIKHPQFISDDILYFTRLKHREQLMFPLKLTETLGLVDIRLDLSEGGGFTCQAVAARLAISRALASLVNEDQLTRLRLAGLLTEDVRHKERKMYGREGARRRYKWRKR